MPLDTSLQTQLKLLLGSLILAVAVTGIAWKCGFYRYSIKEELSPPQPRPKLRLRDLLGAFLLFFGIMLVVPVLLAFLLSLEKFELDLPTRGWINVFSLVVAVVAMLFYCFIFNEGTYKQVWGSAAFRDFKGALADFGLGVATYFICNPIVAFVGQTIAVLFAWLEWPLFKNEQVAVRFLKMNMGQPLLLFGTVLLLALAVPVIEEILFRGFLQTWLLGRFSRAIAITFTMVLFALFHFSESQGVDNIELLLSLGVLGRFLSFLREKRQSLWAPIGLHATFNSISIAVIVYT